MRVSIEPADPTSELSASTGGTPTDRPETVRHYGSIRSQSPQSPFVGTQPLFPRDRSSEAGPSRIHQLPRAEGSGSNSDPPSTAGPLIPLRSTATGSSQFYQQFSHMRLRRQDSIVRPSTNPASPQVSGTFTTSTVTALGRRDSREDIEAQRGIFPGLFLSAAGYDYILVLETIKGDSLSRENMEAYIDILRKYGALEK